MIDSGCGPLGFIDHRYVHKNKLATTRLTTPRPLRLADGSSPNHITDFVTIRHRIGPITEDLRLYCYTLDGPDIIVGLPWLQRHNPDIDWVTGTVTVDGQLIARSPRDADTPVAEPPEDQIRILSAPNFLLACRQPGVEVHRIGWAELQRLSTAPATTGRDPWLGTATAPTLLDAIATTPPEVLRSILLGEAPRFEVTPAISEFQAFVEEYPWLFRVSEEDIDKYIQGKPPLTRSDILSRLPLDYHDLVEAFIPANAETLPPHRAFDHRIELEPGKSPPYYRARPMSPSELKAIRKYLDDHLQKGFIRPSNSPAAAPVLIARKPGGGIRICVDYRGLNNVTVKNRYPIPLIRETLDALCHAKVYTKLDITAAFNRIRIAPGDEWKSAFITRFGLFECLVANFGMTGAPSTFQHYINHVLFDLLDKYATAYLDDILIYSKNRKEHKTHVREVLQRLRTAGLTIDIQKCEFNVTATKYLGLIISTTGIRMDPEKVLAITQWAYPDSVKQLQRFLGFANFYRRFIRGFSRIAAPLTSLLKAGKWDGEMPPEARTAFDELKDAFTTAPVLAFYDPRLETVLEADASDWASGGVLSQVGTDGLTRPVAFYSSKHSPAECNYEIYDKELLAIVKAFEEWRPELQGTEEPVKVLTDHKNLQHFATTKLLNQRQVRWSEFLSDFRFQIVYRPGKKALVPDALSRLPGDRPTSTTDVSDDRVSHRVRTLLPPDRWTEPEAADEDEEPGYAARPARFRYLYATDPSGLPPLETPACIECIQLYALDTSQPIDQLIDRAYAESPLTHDVLAELLTPGGKFPRPIAREFGAAKADCTVVQGRIFVKERLYIPPQGDLRLQILHRTHGSAPGGHPGNYKTYDLLRRAYYWPRLSRDATDFVQGCNLCKRTKTSRSKPQGFLQPLPVPFKPWSDISVDYVGPLPPCERHGVTYTHTLVVVDRLTKMRHLIPVADTTAGTLGNTFVANVYRLHGTPLTIVSDRGTQFVSDFWKELSRLLGITLHASTAFHPESDGQTEILNAVMEQYLRAFCGFYQDDWVDWLPLAEFSANNHTSETTGVSPFFANYGWHPRMGTEPVPANETDTDVLQKQGHFDAAAAADRIGRITEKTRAFMAEAQARQAHFADRHRDDAGTFRIGELVWISTENLRTARPMKKLDAKFIGPFPVTKVYPRAVAVQLPPERRLFPVFHVSLVRRDATGYPGQGAVNAEYDRRADGAVAADEETIEWFFEAILDSRFKKVNGKKELQYKVKWPHPYRPGWEPAENLKGCDSDIDAFHRKYPEKPGPPEWFVPNPLLREDRE
jgi:hypothetical protein